MSVKIPVEAQLDAADLKQSIDQFVAQFNKLGAVIAQANKVKFTPIDKATIDDMRKVTAQFESLRKISGALNTRIKATGQGGNDFFGLDWGKLYSDQNARAREMRKAFEYVTNRQFNGPIGQNPYPNRPPPNQPPPPPPNPGVNWGQQGRNIVGRGLQAMGPAGGVANNALTSGLANGAIAGLAGLAGGLLALGVGKAIGAIKEKIGDAQTELTGYDTLKRQLGDVNVEFGALKTNLRAVADVLDVTFSESQRLSTEFARISGISPDLYKTLGSETAIGGGFGRSFGLDPSTSNAFFAQARGLGITRNESDTRKLALQIGEGIARSGAFAKAEEFLNAVGGYSAQQTRLGLSAANVSGYAGMLAGMTSRGIPGLDLQGSAALLGRVNSSIAGGGSAGEAGQNFLYAAIGRRLGLDPIQAAVLREQGAFGTGAGTFGEGSVYSQYTKRFGGASAGGAAGSNTTNLQMVMDQFKKSYAGRPELMADAMANFFGINTSQAMALSLTDSADLGGIMGRLQRSGTGLDLSKLSYTGIAALGRIQTGGRDTLEAQANSLFGRTGQDALSPLERQRLTDAMGSGDDETFRDVLTELTATREQEKTEGSETRRTVVGVQNEIQRLAAATVPLLNDMRAGILFLAGGGKKGPMGIQMAVAEAESAERRSAIEAQFANGTRGGAVGGTTKGGAYVGVGTGRGMTSAQYAASRDRASALAAEDARLQAQQASIRDNFLGTAGTSDDVLFNALIQQESGGRHTDAKGNLITNKDSGAQGISQLMPGTAKNPGYGITGVKDQSEAEYLRVGRQYLNAMQRKYGDRSKALAAYNWGPGNVDKAIAAKGDNWMSSLPAETAKYIPSILAMADGHGTQTPGGVTGGASSAQQVAINGNFTLNNPNGTQAAAPVSVRTQVGVPVPYGAR